MKKRLVVITIVIVFGLLGTYQLFKDGINPAEETFSNAVLEYGAQGKDVWELQSRLMLLGYYSGIVDGDFGWQTLRAVKDFQYKFGMKVDGIVGSKTKYKLWKATPHWRPKQTWEQVRNRTAPTTPAPARRTPPPEQTSSNRLGLSAMDLKIMANAVHGEARGEPFVGQVAVAAVILNRVESPSFPNTVSGVIFQPGAFTAVADGQIWLEPDDTSQRAVREALNGYDPTGGAIYYFNPATATSKWIWSRPQIKQIGKHIFCR